LVHNLRVRTNVTLEDDVYQLASVYASAKGITLGAAIGELIRKADATPDSPSPSPRLITAPNGLRIVPPSGRIITSEMVKEALEEDDLD
jgi:hypothetical protein